MPFRRKNMTSQRLPEAAAVATRVPVASPSAVTETRSPVASAARTIGLVAILLRYYVRAGRRNGQRVL